MENYNQHIEHIDQYINGLLSESDNALFEEKVKTNPDFEAIYNEHLVLVEGIKRKTLKGEIQQAKRHYLQVKWLKYIAIVILVVAILVLLFGLFSKPETPINNNQQYKNSNVVVVDTILVEEQNQIEKLSVDQMDNTTKVIDKNDIKSVSENLEESNKIHTTDTIENDVISVIDTVELKSNVLSESFYESVKKTPEIIQIFNEKELTITCKEGTRLNIPTKAFVYEDTGRLVRGKLEIAVTEYYKLSDMLLANLNTKSDDQILETGGMLYLEANKDGRRLRLKTGKQIEIEFSNGGKQRMQLFVGEEVDRQMDWKLSKPIEFISQDSTALAVVSLDTVLEEEDVEVPIHVVEEVPIVSGCEGGSKDDKRQCLQAYFRTLIKENYDLGIAEELNLIGKHKIQVVFKIGKEGDIVDIEVFSAHTKLGQEVIRVLELVPKMIPGKQRGKPVLVPYSLPIVITVGESNKRNPNLIKVKAKTRLDNNRSESYRFYRDSIIDSGDNQVKEALVNGELSFNDVTNYMLSTSQLGWINCDRFMRFNNRFRFRFKVNNIEGADIKLIFHDMASILPSKSKRNMVDFGSVPNGKSVTVLAIKEFNGQFYLATKALTTEAIKTLELDFKPVTLIELESELIELNEVFEK